GSPAPRACCPDLTIPSPTSLILSAYTRRSTRVLPRRGRERSARIIASRPTSTRKRSARCSRPTIPRSRCESPHERWIAERSPGSVSLGIAVEHDLIRPLARGAALLGFMHSPDHGRRAGQLLDQKRDLVRQVVDVPAEKIRAGEIVMVEIRPVPFLL